MIVTVGDQEIEFPDDMPPEQIESILRSQLSRQPVQPTRDPAYLAGPLRAILQPPSFGFADEIESAIRGVPHEQIQADMKQWEGDYPGANLLAQGSSGLLTAALGSGALGAAKQSLPAVGKAAAWAVDNIPRWARVVGPSAAATGLYGAGAADPGERVEGAATGAAIGTLVSGGLLAGTAGVGKAYESILKPLWRQIASTPKRDYSFIIQDALRREGLTPEQALKALEDSGDGAMMLDLGPALRDLAYDVRAGRGPGRTIVDGALKARQAGQPARIMNAAGQSLGAYADDAGEFIANVTKAQHEQAAPLYRIAHQQNIRTNPEFEKLWKGVPKSAIDDARKLAEKEWRAGLLEANFPEVARSINPARTLPGNGGSLLDPVDEFRFDDLPDVLKIDYVKRAYDDVIGAQLRNEGKKQLSRADIVLRNKILDFVDEQVPEFKQARGIWAGAEQLKSATELGREAFKQDADELADIVKRYGESEKLAFRYGVAQAFRDAVESTGSKTSDAGRKLAGSLAKQRIIKAAFGNDEEFARFMKQIDTDARSTESLYEITGNSKTPERLRRYAERTGEMPEATREGALMWLRNNFGPQDPLLNEETNRMVAEWLIQQKSPVIPLAPQASPIRGLLDPRLLPGPR